MAYSCFLFLFSLYGNNISLRLFLIILLLQFPSMISTVCAASCRNHVTGNQRDDVMIRGTMTNCISSARQVRNWSLNEDDASQRHSPNCRFNQMWSVFITKANCTFSKEKHKFLTRSSLQLTVSVILEIRHRPPSLHSFASPLRLWSLNSFRTNTQRPQIKTLPFSFLQRKYAPVTLSYNALRTTSLTSHRKWW